MTLEVIDRRRAPPLTRFKLALDDYGAAVRELAEAFGTLPADQQQQFGGSLEKLFMPAEALRKAVQAAMKSEAVELVRFRTGSDGRIIAATRERVLRDELAEHLRE
jgi:hypothetical protein